MIEACRAAAVPLWVGYYRRALPRFIKVKDLIKAGAIGPVRMVISRQFARLPDLSADGQIPWRINPSLSGGGFFYEAVCHTFDFLDFLFGPIVKVGGFAANQAAAYKPEDVVVAAYKFESGVQGSGTWCYCADHDYEMNEIIGAGAAFNFQHLRQYRSDSYAVTPWKNFRLAIHRTFTSH